MSAKLKRTERGRRFRRSRVSINERRGVSPVVATLILILIAVAAAAALYLWLVAWQGGVTSGIGSPGAQYTITIGGSTSVYPWSVAAVKSFEGNNSNIVISVNQGGSGAGMAAVCSGQVDIGASSAPQATLVSQYACPSTVVQETVAYDAVDPIVSTANVHGISSISWDTYQAIYIAAVGGAPTPVQAQTNMESAATGYSMNGQHVVAPAAATGFVWDQIPACSTYTGEIYPPTYGLNCKPVVGVDIVATNATAPALAVSNAAVTELPLSGGVGSAAGESPCGWSVCAGGASYAAGGAAPCFAAVTTVVACDSIHPVQRQDAGGTTQSFTGRLLEIGTGNTSATSGIGFTGCAPTGQLTDCGITEKYLGTGNPGVISVTAGDKDAIGYASDGLVITAGSGVVTFGFQGIGQPNPVVPLVATTIVTGIQDGSGYGTYGTASYVGWRPFIYVQTAPPTGEVLRYLQWCMQPGNNQQFALEANEISPFQPGLAGHVPVTPIP
ncbi:MAG: substrate-binding domain-containing protein [Thermoplasmata archaeon]